MLAGFAIAVGSFLAHHRRQPRPIGGLQRIRCTLGAYVALGLEALIVADVLDTLVTRSLLDLAYLGGLVVVRTLIAFFLGKEVEQLGREAVAEE